MSPELGQEKQIVAVDSQRLDAIQSCMYLFDLKFNKRMVPVHTPDYLERGSLIHEMLAAYYKLRAHRSRWRVNHKFHGDIVQSCIKIGRHAGNRMELDIAEVERTIEVFQEYAEFWENDGWDNVEAVESVGSKILYEDDKLIILYEVKIDLILNLPKRTPVDHKHAQSRREPNQMANQFKGYCWFLGVNSILVNEVGFQKTVKPVDKFRRHPVSYSDSQIDEWRMNSVYWVRYALSCIENKFYPLNFTSCDKYSGCDFKVDVCGQDPAMREYKLQKLFKIRDWDPGKAHL